MRICETAGCGQPHYGKGLCRLHYRRQKEGLHKEPAATRCGHCGAPLGEGRPDRKFCSQRCMQDNHGANYTRERKLENRGPCTIDGCDEPRETKLYCRAHYMRMWRNGDPLKVRHDVVKCLHDGCEETGRFRVGYCTKHYMADYLDKNREAIYATIHAQRAYFKKAMPVWADVKKIKAIYHLCRETTKETGIEHEVDHRLPLRGRLICGLHVPRNLRIIPRSENRTKSYRFEPYTVVGHEEP